jgi:IS4 transposase
LLAKNGDIVDVLAKLRRLKHGAVLDEDLAARCDGGPIDGRLIAMRLPDDAAERARQRVRKEKGASASAESLEAAGFVVLFTTALRDRLSAERCLEGYRVRWQIELQFKRWKSLCGFDMLPNQRDDTILAWLYAKVLLGALLDRMASIPTEISPPASSNLATDGMRSLEADQHPVPPRHRRPAATRAA